MARAIPQLLCTALLVGATACDGSTKKKADPDASLAPAAHVASSAPVRRMPGPGISVGGRGTKLATLPSGFELGEVAFSRDGRHVGFVATREGQVVVVLDGKQSRPYEGARGLVFEEGGSAFAHVAREGGSEFVVVNGKEGARYDAVATIRFAPDGTILYSATRNQRWWVVAGARELAVCSAADPSPTSIGKGKWLVFVEQCAETHKSSLRACTLRMKGCTRGVEYDRIGSPHVDGSGTVFGFIAEKDGQQAVVAASLRDSVLRERAGGWYDKVYFFSMSDGGEHVAAFANRGDQVVLVKDGEERPFTGTEGPLDFAVSQNGRVMWTKIDGEKVTVFVEGKRVGGEYQGVDFLGFSPDGSRTCFVATSGQGNALVVDGREGPHFDKVVTPKFTPDGTRVVYRVRSGGERFVAVSDAEAKLVREYPHFEAVFDVGFPAGASVGYLVRAGQDLFWRLEELK